jgi:Ni/Fe-hydrogenase subunit HybB-like protein
MDRANVFKSILWAITGLAVAAGITRFVFGLGAISNLNDSTAWGIWKGFNVIPGIALAAGGFVVTAIIYIMKKEEYHRYAKVAVLLAFLGYVSAATALVIELGLPWLIWHPVIYWQHHSALFEVSWCVMLYLTVLLLEFLPVPLEETSKFAGIRRFLTKHKLVLVFLGIMISTLHQSSLGTLFLITPEKLHPLWYTPLLPILFLLSAVGVGPLMLILGILTIRYVYRKDTDTETLAKLAFPAFIVVAICGLIRIVDIGARGKFPIIFDGSWQSAVFLIEIALTVIIPVILLGVRKLRYSQAGLAIASLCAVIGLGLDRANIAGIMLKSAGPQYVPTIFEVFVSLGIVTGAILAFLFAIERYKVWDVKWEDPRERIESRPKFGRASEVWLGTPRLAGRTVYSLLFVISLGVGFAIIPSKRLYSGGVKEVTAEKARGGDTLFVDGNRDGYGVTFKHDFHIALYGKERSCALCHHMNLPMDKQSGCYACHRDMYSPSDAFRHDWHASPTGANIACGECHAVDKERTAATAKKCEDCHKDLFVQGALIEVEKHMASSYTDAMHGLCVNCHKKKALELPNKPNLARCTTCHESTPPDYLQGVLKEQRGGPSFNPVVLPGASVQRGEP